MYRLCTTSLLTSLVLAGALTFSTLARGADANGHFSVRGTGLLTCEQFIRIRASRDNAYYAVAGWLNGYLTARNQLDPKTYDVIPFESVPMLLAIVDQHCRRFPKQAYFTVVNSLVAELAKDRIKRKSPLVQVKVGKQTALYYLDVIQRMQLRLKQLGYYHGKLEPRFGAALQKALAAFQQTKGLKADGFPDQPTLLSLFGRLSPPAEKD